MKKCIFVSGPLVVLAISLLVGCSSSPPVRLYMIEPITAAESKREAQPLTIAIGPVQLAEHLNRSEILTRAEPYKVSVAEYDRWAEPIDSNIAAVLAENLSILVPAASVHTYPRDKAYDADYTICVHILRFGTHSDNEVVLKVDWTIEDSAGRKIKHHRSRYAEPRRDSEMVSMVEALSRNVEQLSRDIADAVHEAKHD
jgi:uncharacterized lipoprotein YmbA